MTYRNHADIVAQLQGAGLVLDTAKSKDGSCYAGLYIETNKSVRCDTLDKPKKRSGAYKLHELHLRDGIWLAGAYWLDHGNTYYKLELNKECADCGASIPLKSSTCPACGSTKKPKVRDIPQEEIERHKLAMAESKRQAEAAEKARHEQAASWAAAVWRASTPATLDDHDYFARKGLVETGGARIFPDNDGLHLDGATDDDYRKLGQYAGAIVLPAQDLEGKTWALQFILSRAKHADLIKRMETDKMFWPSGANTDGMLYQIGGSAQVMGMVCEGYATGLTLKQASNRPVVLAWNAGNVPKVVARLRKRHKHAKLLVCADDDWLQSCIACKQYTPVATDTCVHCGQPHGKSNAGVRFARVAATGQDVAWVAPVFSVDRPTNRKGPTDYNDLAALEGVATVQRQIEDKIAALEWDRATPVLARGALSQGGGDGGNRSPGDYPEARSIMTVDELCERYIWIDSAKGGVVWDDWKRELADFGKVTDQLPARTRRDDIKDHPLWQQRACHIEHIGFDPSEKDPNVRLNTWWGWPMQPKAGECASILDHLWWLTGEEKNETVRKQAYDYLIWWMAYPLQVPGAKHTSAIIMHGPQGTGKSIVFQRVLAKIYGRGKLPKFDYSVILDQKALQDNFNAPWENKLFVLTEEAVTSSDKWQLKNELKELVTGEQIRIRKVFTDAYYQKNQLNMAFLSNEDQPLPLDNTDRRHLVIYTPAKLDQSYYLNLLDEIENGGIDAFYDYLMHVDLTQFKIGQAPPETAAKTRLVDLSKSSELRFVDEWVAGHTLWPVTPCKSDDFYAAYKHWCRINGENFPRSSNYFWAPIMRPENKWAKTRMMLWDNLHHTSDKKQHTVQIPPGHILEQNGTAQPPDKTEQQWVSDCCIEFANVLEGLK